MFYSLKVCVLLVFKIFLLKYSCSGFLGGSAVKNLPANEEDMGLIPGQGRPSGEGNGNPLQCSCLGNPIDRDAGQATVHGVAKEPDTT